MLPLVGSTYRSSQKKGARQLPSPQGAKGAQAHPEGLGASPGQRNRRKKSVDGRKKMKKGISQRRNRIAGLQILATTPEKDEPFWGGWKTTAAVRVTRQERIWKTFDKAG